jgi:hypothetical protein
MVSNEALLMHVPHLMLILTLSDFTADSDTFAAQTGPFIPNGTNTTTPTHTHTMA